MSTTNKSSHKTPEFQHIKYHQQPTHAHGTQIFQHIECHQKRNHAHRAQTFQHVECYQRRWYAYRTQIFQYIECHRQHSHAFRIHTLQHKEWNNNQVTSTEPRYFRKQNLINNLVYCSSYDMCSHETRSRSTIQNAYFRIMHLFSTRSLILKALHTTSHN